MTGVLYLAWQHLRWHRWKAAILVMAVTLVLYLPLGLELVVQQTARDMNARADATPLVLGKRGSPLELVLNTLYFADEQPGSLEFGIVDELRNSALVDPIPLHARHSSQDAPIVGTTLDYFFNQGLNNRASQLNANLPNRVGRFGIDIPLIQLRLIFILYG